MKQTYKKPSFGSFTPLFVVVAIACLPYFWPHDRPNAPVIQPVALSSPAQSSTKSSSHEQVADNQPVQSATKQQIAAITAPEQAAIMQSVTTEYVYHMFGSVNDTYASADWTLAKDAAPAAWDISTGNNQTIVADIDTGFALNHEDLTNQWYQNPGETGMTQAGDRCWAGTPQDKSANGCDDDNNGYVDDWRGWNFVKADNNPQAGRINPTGQGVWHGTATAGFIGATGNNSKGTSAIDQHTKILPLTVLDDDGTGYTSDITAAVYYAVGNHANVINLSLGAFANDPALRTAITYAISHNVVVVAAAGNCGDSGDPNCSGISPTTIAYPAAYPDVIAVGASTSSDQRASFSSYGDALDVSAPGYNLPVGLMWTPSNQTAAYASGLYGTSFASPQVASLVALIKSIRPSSSVGDITALVDATASKPSGMNGLMYAVNLGHGIINAGNALTIAQTLNSTSGTPTLLQAGSAQAEHETYAATTISSGCQISSGACTIEFTGSSGFKRYLPYTSMTSGDAGWLWSSDMLSSDLWSIRARVGDNLSAAPYSLLKKS
jgi:subtilisin family serine protease